MNIKHLEKPLFKLIDDIFGGPTVLKGYDCIQSATHIKNMWDSFERPVAIGLDASRFDQHCSEEMLEWEHEVWRMMCTDKRKVDQLLKWQRDNRGVAYVDDGKIKYRVKGCRMSGDMNTSSGNCLIMCAMVWCYCRSLGITKFRLANNGDDCTLIVEQSHKKTVLANLDSFFLNLGYTMKVEAPVYELERINFCQTQPVFDGIGYRMVRDPRVAMAKDLCCLLDLSNSRTRELWHDAMRHGGTSLTTGIPMWQNFYRMFPEGKIRETKEEITLNRFRESGFYRMIPTIANKDYRAPTPEARYSFWLAFGINPDTQIILEDRFNNINLAKCAIVGQEDYVELSVLVE
nr:MAG: RNA-dependent RNA polymerase [Chemarfal virus 201]